MSGRLVEIIELDNDLKVEIWDLSRVLAGDRWLVSLEARADVPLAPEVLSSTDEKEKLLEVLRRVYGDKVSYRYKQERHFVDKREKEALFQEFLGILKRNVVPYLSHRDFARRLVASKIRELKARDPRLFF
ncbi:MAG TPA: hypothetical protein ENF92_03950 [Desulfobacteraceae bacterium]|nr:hypothetical protein [Desulfobacteraceae bacterium]